MNCNKQAEGKGRVCDVICHRVTTAPKGSRERGQRTGNGWEKRVGGPIMQLQRERERKEREGGGGC